MPICKLKPKVPDCYLQYLMCASLSRESNMRIHSFTTELFFNSYNGNECVGILGFDGKSSLHILRSGIICSLQSKAGKRSTNTKLILRNLIFSELITRCCDMFADNVKCIGIWSLPSVAFSGYLPPAKSLSGSG